MKIVVCIKQVPDTKGGVKFNPDGTLDRSAMLAVRKTQIPSSPCVARVSGAADNSPMMAVISPQDVMSAL